MDQATAKPIEAYGYHRWFAWRPVLLNCPEGLGDPVKRSVRIAWLRNVWRSQADGKTYYAIFYGIKC
jgi:hypothetical protein